ITILQCGGGWPDSIGNAFIDFGSMYALKKAVGKSNVILSSNFPKSFLSRGFVSNRLRILDFSILDKTNNLLDVREIARPDYIVLSGEILSTDWIRLCVARNFFKSTTKIIIHGGGGRDYTQQEFEVVRDFLRRINLYAFISRDERVFDEYKGIAQHSFNGIDCGFFARDYFNPITLDLPKYITLTFDKIEEPEFKNEQRMIIRTHHAFWSQCGFLKKIAYYKRQNFSKKNTLISDLPEDYLNIYANTEETHSDRLHACVPTLAFGKPAKLYIKTPRATLFDRVNAGSVKNELTKPDLGKIEKEKERQIRFLSEILSVN
ncbi:MAG: hypothetical protein ACPL3B_04240, partial [Fervidobacterium sp.]